MTPSARLAAAIEILDGLRATTAPADRFIRQWFTTRRFAGSADRRAIGETVFQALRHRASLSWRMGSETPRALVIAGLLAEGRDPQTLFTGGYGPSPLTPEEAAAIAMPPRDPPLWVRGEFPAWLEPELTRRFGTRLEEEMAGFAQRAPVDLRVNTLKAERAPVLAALQADGFDAIPVGENAIRCPPGTLHLNKHPLFLSGAFEIQGLAAQIAVEQARAQPGMRVLDLAAGAGGKSLALAAAMQNRGEVIACDIRGAALAELEVRAARAGAGIICAHILDIPPPGPFDLVFIDAPCSGSGTWRRQPELKWRLAPERLTRLAATQDGLLAQGAARCSGLLVYATCSILPCENQDRAAAFLQENPRFARSQPDFQASPATTGSDGFYAAYLANNGDMTSGPGND